MRRKLANKNCLHRASHIMPLLQSVICSLLITAYIFPMQTAFTTKKDYGKEEREAHWARDQRTLHGLQPPETTEVFKDKNNYAELSEIAEQARKRAEVARYRPEGTDHI